MITTNEFAKELECVYKGERYSVRDNGAVMRHVVDVERPRKADNVWTFGKPSNKTGYMEIAGERVHRIVAVAFYGEAPTKGHVVDHIDTNKQNNRPENLRWVTKLENVLLNPITAKRIAMVCGSVEAFLADPSKFRDKFLEPNYSWMCTVSAEEAQISLQRMLSWANSDKEYSGGTLEKWVFMRPNDVHERKQSQYKFSDEHNDEKLQPSEQISFKQAESVKSVPLPQIAVKRGRETPPGFPHRLTITDDSSLATYGTQNALNALIQKLLEERSAITRLTQMLCGES